MSLSMDADLSTRARIALNSVGAGTDTINLNVMVKGGVAYLAGFADAFVLNNAKAAIEAVPGIVGVEVSVSESGGGEADAGE